MSDNGKRAAPTRELRCDTEPDLELELVRQAAGELRIIGATSDDPAAGLDHSAEQLAAMGFEAKRDQTLALPGSDGDPGVLLVGLGASEDLDAAALRRGTAVAVRAARRRDGVAVELLGTLADSAGPAERAEAAGAIAEGAVLGSYRFGRYKTGNDSSRLGRVAVVGTGGARVREAIDRGARLAGAQCLARDLVNEPGGSLTPERFAGVARAAGEAAGLAVTVMDQDQLTAEHMGGILGVNRGSTNPPRLVKVVYEPDNPRGTLALVGKGITFDSGGLSLKPAEAMMAMKNDMSGAAAVLGAMVAMPVVEPRWRVEGYMPLTDNMTGGDATRPGDVLVTRSGTTVEVLNTDAEGRLVLADAIALASEGRPDAIVDMATLTGAIDVALGPHCAGLMGNSEDLIALIGEAAARTGERVWQLPLPDDYRPWLDSEVADLRNISKVRSAGSITAGLFLSRFVGEKIPWAHLDIASVAWSGDTRGADAAGGTGYGVRLAVELARSMRRPRP